MFGVCIVHVLCMYASHSMLWLQLPFAVRIRPLFVCLCVAQRSMRSGRDLFASKRMNKSQSSASMGWHFCVWQTVCTARGLRTGENRRTCCATAPDGGKCYTFKWKCFLNDCGKALYSLYMSYSRVCDSIVYSAGEKRFCFVRSHG